MKLKRRRDWKPGKSITQGRSRGGQIILKKLGKSEGEDTFLVRIGKDASRQITGRPQDARRTLRELREELDGGMYRPTRATRLDHFLERVFLPWKRLSTMPKTYGEYQRIVEDRIVPVLGHHRLDSLSEDVIQAWVDGLWDEDLAGKTIKEYFGLLRAALKRATQLDLVPKNPADGVVYSRRSEDWWLGDPFGDEVPGAEAQNGVDLSRVWTEEEYGRFMRTSDPSLEIVRWIRLGVELGLRPQELCGLRWKDVSIDGPGDPVIRVCGAVIEVDPDRREELGKWVWGKAKTGDRVITASPEAIEALRLQQAAIRAEKLDPKRAMWVFPSRQGGRPFNNPCNIKNRQAKFLKDHEDYRYIPPYGLRHTHATHLLRSGWEAVKVAFRLGTGLEMIAKHYGHLLPDEEVEMLGNLPKPGAEAEPGDPEIPAGSKSEQASRRVA